MDQKPESTNPLSGHFRQAAIYFKLPSQGQYWPNDSLVQTASGELPVLPMTAKDEITLRTPDALMNGQGVVDVIQSCVPTITNAWDMPSIDLDATLISVRIASYGKQMDFNSACPSCKEENEYAIDLTGCLDSIKMPDYNKTVDQNGLKIKLRPQTYFNFNRSNMINFEEQQILKTLGDADTMTEEELKAKFDRHLDKVIDLNVEILASSTEYIELDSGVKVLEQTYIKEFYANTDTRVIKAVRDRLAELSAEAAIKPQQVTCANCATEYGVSINFDYASFFETGS
jgi:hypothetical protein